MFLCLFQLLKQQQKGLTHLIDITKEDVQDLNVIDKDSLTYWGLSLSSLSIYLSIFLFINLRTRTYRHTRLGLTLLSLSLSLSRTNGTLERMEHSLSLTHTHCRHLPVASNSTLSLSPTLPTSSSSQRRAARLLHAHLRAPRLGVSPHTH